MTNLLSRGDHAEIPLVSIIIPVYKVEKYLGRCINSAVNQTYHNLEIIVVDDGSPDRCPQLCDEWAAKDSRIRVVHKNNGGLSSARNAGLDICQGEYLCFIDSDDWASNDMVEVLLKCCQTNQAKLAICGRYDVYEEQGIQTIGKNLCQDKVMDPKTAVSQMLTGKEFDCSAWGKLYHRSLWQDFRFPFRRIYEDVAILYKVVLAADRVALVNKPMYFYLRRPDSITSSSFTEALLDYPYNTRKLLQDLKENQPDLFNYACWTHTKAVIHVLSKLARSEKSIYIKHINTFKALSKELFSYRSTWLCADVFTRKDVLLCCIFSNWYLIRLLYKLKKFVKK